LSRYVLPKNGYPFPVALLSAFITDQPLHKQKNYTAWLLLTIGVAILVYLLLESRQRSRRLEKALQQTTIPTAKPNQP
jgi:hypothetical protein